MKISLTVDIEKCVKCYSCIAECPFDLINEDKEGFPQLRKAALRRCIRCGHCMAVCGSGALDISISPLAESIPVDKKLLPTSQSVEHFLKGRRSIRTYKNRVADHETLAAILDVSRYAPSAHTCQSAHWSMVDDPAEVKRLAGMVVDYMREIKVFPGLIRAWDLGEDKVLRGAPHLAICHADPKKSEHPVEDCTLSTAYLDLSASSFGLGSCWAGFLVQAFYKHKPLVDALALPENHIVYTALMLGYPKFKYRNIPQRDELKVTWR